MIHVAVEQCPAGDILVVAPTSPLRRRLFRRPAGRAPRGARRAWRSIIDAGVRDVAALTEMRLPGVVQGRLRAGHGEGDAGQRADPVVCAGAAIRPGDVIVADDDGVVRRAARGGRRRCSKAAQAREANEAAKRARLDGGRARPRHLRHARAARREGPHLRRRLGRRRRSADEPDRHPLHASCAAARRRASMFLAGDLPATARRATRVLLAAMGSPDPRQIDGMGGAHPLTSKVAVVELRAPRRCGRRLSVPAGRGGPARGHRQPELRQHARRRRAVRDRERAGAAAGDGDAACASTCSTPQTLAMAYVQTPGGAVRYDGDARIDGVPGTAAPIPHRVRSTSPARTCGALLPDRQRQPTSSKASRSPASTTACRSCASRASDLGLSGDETPDELEGERRAERRVEAIRLAAGPLHEPRRRHQARPCRR